MTTTQPTMGEVLLLQSPDWMQMPDVDSPYYILGKGKTFIHRRTAQARGLIETTKMPAQMKVVDPTLPRLVFDGATVPATIYAQTVHFFRRIFANHHTEAEVIITQNEETKEYRLFVPTQRVSHGGVYSIYDPRNISRGWIVIGTFHSHCDFGSTHSGIDEGDARDMDGLHGTIGFIDREQPEMSLMYALNKSFFHFAEPFDRVVDTSDLNAATAPAWWDRHVILGAVTDTDRETLAPYADDATWNAFMGRPKVTTAVPYQMPTITRTHTSSGMSEADRRALRNWYGEEYILEESRAFNHHRMSGMDINWGPDGELIRGHTSDDLHNDDYWEDMLGEHFVNEIMATELFTDQDFDDAVQSPSSGTPEYWETVFRLKLMRAVSFLRNQGLSVRVQMKDDRPRPMQQLPGQTTLDAYQGGLL